MISLPEHCQSIANTNLAMGLLQFSTLRRAAETQFSKPGFRQHWFPIRRNSKRGFHYTVRTPKILRGGQVVDEMGGGRNGRSWGAPSFGQKRPARVMDVRAKSFIFPRSERLGESFFGPGRPPAYPPDVRGISRPKTLCLRRFSVPFWTAEDSFKTILNLFSASYFHFWRIHCTISWKWQI